MLPLMLVSSVDELWVEGTQAREQTGAGLTEGELAVASERLPPESITAPSIHMPDTLTIEFLVAPEVLMFPDNPRVLHQLASRRDSIEVWKIKLGTSKRVIFRIKGDAIIYLINYDVTWLYVKMSRTQFENFFVTTRSIASRKKFTLWFLAVLCLSAPKNVSGWKRSERLSSCCPRLDPDVTLPNQLSWTLEALCTITLIYSIGSSGPSHISCQLGEGMVWSLAQLSLSKV